MSREFNRAPNVPRCHIRSENDDVIAVLDEHGHLRRMPSFLAIPSLNNIEELDKQVALEMKRCCSAILGMVCTNVENGCNEAGGYLLYERMEWDQSEENIIVYETPSGSSNTQKSDEFPRTKAKDEIVFIEPRNSFIPLIPSL